MNKAKVKKSGILVAGLIALLTMMLPAAKPANATVGTCACSTCAASIRTDHNNIRQNINDEFDKHERWVVDIWFEQNVLPAMQLMAMQLTTAGMMQVEAIGMMLDAKHQLETQRLFQTLSARAHKDYHPSEGMCTFGTNVRSLASSERRSNIAQTAVAQRMMQRQTLNGAGVAVGSGDSDIRSRLYTFIATYCDPGDNGNGLTSLCRTNTAPGRRNIDVDFTRNIESRLTLDLNFPGAGAPVLNPATTGNPPSPGPAVNSGATDITADETDVFALSANLFSHVVPTHVPSGKLASSRAPNPVHIGNVERYMDLRSVLAKRSVAQNSFAAMVSMRAAGDPSTAPYTKAIMRELGVGSEADINSILGNNPSYFAQMEVLTKKLYQNPLFYTELYDKPANIERKGAALQAIGLMQDRDLYNSLLRSEAVLSVLLETMLQKEQEKAVSALPGAGGG